MRKKTVKPADGVVSENESIGKKLGPENMSQMMGGLQDIDPESDDGAEMEAELTALDKLCAK